MDSPKLDLGAGGRNPADNPGTPATILHWGGGSMIARAAIETAIEALIALLDALDGDPDLEDGDPCGQCDEDGINTGNGVFALHGMAFDGPGCPISDEPEEGSQPLEIATR